MEIQFLSYQVQLKAPHQDTLHYASVRMIQVQEPVLENIWILAVSI